MLNTLWPYLPITPCISAGSLQQALMRDDGPKHHPFPDPIMSSLL